MQFWWTTPGPFGGWCRAASETQGKRDGSGFACDIGAAASNGSNVDVRPVVEVWLMQSREAGCTLGRKSKIKRSERERDGVLKFCLAVSLPLIAIPLTPPPPPLI